MKSTLTTKQIKAKLSSIEYALESGELAYELLEGYMDTDAEDTELAPFVLNAKTSLEALLNKFHDMCEQYDLQTYQDNAIKESDDQLSFDLTEE